MLGERARGGPGKKEAAVTDEAWKELMEERRSIVTLWNQARKGSDGLDPGELAILTALGAVAQGLLYVGDCISKTGAA